MYRKLLYVVLFAALLGLAATSQPALAQDNNLLQNPGFEGGYSAYRPQTAQEHADCPHGICNTVQIPSGWRPWWVKARSSDANPEYKAAAPFANRIHSGSNAGQYFTFHRTHEAGFMQQVNVPDNAVLQFSIWGQAWMTSGDSASSDSNAIINMRVGIDPTGGTNPTSSNIVWSGSANPFDAYRQFSVQVQAQGNRVTVFTYSRAEYPLKHNDVYWDDATLFVVGQQPAPPPPPAPSPPPPSDGGGAPPAGGVHVVQGGETLYSIAQRYGTTVAAITAANNIANPNLIRPGQQLTIPGGTGDSGEPAPPPPVEGLRATTQANLRLRSGPGTNYQILTVLPYGTVVDVLARNASSDWIRVSYGGQVGWVAAWYTAISGGSINSAPIQS
jgi:LysM repeat protein